MTASSNEESPLASQQALAMQHLWFSLTNDRAWHSLALVAGDEEVCVSPLAYALASVAALAGDPDFIAGTTG